jgi:hypothetical protein
MPHVEFHRLGGWHFSATGQVTSPWRVTVVGFQIGKSWYSNFPIGDFAFHGFRFGLVVFLWARMNDVFLSY